MATFNTGAPNFLLPGWMTFPIADVLTVSSGITPAAIHRVMYLSSVWKLDASFSWSVTEIAGPYAETGVASLTALPFSAGPLDELELETTVWTGFTFGNLTSFPMTGSYTFSGGGVDFTRSLATGFFGGGEFSWIAEDLVRPNLWNSQELALPGSISFESPTDTPTNPGFSHREYTLAIAWQSGEPGSPFYGEVSVDDAFEGGVDGGTTGYDFTFSANIRVTPTLYWGWDGAIDTTTGEPT